MDTEKRHTLWGEMMLGDFNEQFGFLASARKFWHCHYKTTHFFGLAAALLLSSLVAARADDSEKPAAQQRDPIETVLVTGTREPPPSDDAGYKPDVATTTGPWGSMPVQDAPYSITVLPSTLIENSSARNVDELFNLAPFVQAGQSEDVNGIAQATIRGFSVARAYVNGVQNNNLGMGVFPEEIGQLEILNGLSGFLYGASPVGGLINYQLKQPTDYDLRNLTVGDYGGDQYYAHLDVGGTIDTNKQFGYRANFLFQDGGTEIQDQKLRRVMASGSFDWRPSDKMVLELFLSREAYRMDGRQFQFYLGSDVPSPLDGSKLYSPKDTYLNVDSDFAGLNFTYQPTSALAVRAAYQYKKDTRSLVYTLGSLQADEDYYQFYLYGGRNAAETQGAYFYVDSTFFTGPVQHKLTVGGNGYYYNNYLAILSNGLPSFFAGPFTYALTDRSVVDLPVPNWDLDDSHWVANAKSENINAVIGDEITLNSKWSMLAGLNQSTIRSQSYDFTTGKPSPGTLYSKSALTPTASIIYKPDSIWTTYASYMESLESGGIVGPTYANANQILPPLVSRQLEAGVKANFDKILLTADVFNIDRASERSNDGTMTGTYLEDGLEVHKGLEISAIGRPLEELSLLAGLTLMNNSIHKSADPSLNGKQPNAVAEDLFKIRAEYSPKALSGWTFVAGIDFNGDSYQDPLNTRKLPSYALFDLGLRYQLDVFGHSVLARLNVLNVTDKRYWAATSPGEPRTIAFSLSTGL